jgi:hypothetical protein
MSWPRRLDLRSAILAVSDILLLLACDLLPLLWSCRSVKILLAAEIVTEVRELWLGQA